MPVDLKAGSSILSEGKFLLYGQSGSGKTRFAGTFPKPVFFADSTEAGWSTLSGMDPKKDFFEPNVYPIVEPISSAQEMTTLLGKYEPYFKSKKYRTLVVDSLTFYVDSYLSYLSMRSEMKDGRQVYQALYNHLRYLMIRAHQMADFVVWTCLLKEPDHPGGEANVMLPGKIKTMAPAAASYFLYLSIENSNPKEPPKFSIHTKKYGIFPARVRGGTEALPSPLEENTFKCFVKALGKGLPNTL